MDADEIMKGSTVESRMGAWIVACVVGISFLVGHPDGLRAHWPDGIVVVGVNTVDPFLEQQMIYDIEQTLSERSDAFQTCYRRHASQGEVVTVDWTITLDGSAVDIAVYADRYRMETCVESALSGLSFLPAYDRHPRARAELYFGDD
jgi:hypothetical protein